MYVEPSIADGRTYRPRVSVSFHTEDGVFQGIGGYYIDSNGKYIKYEGDAMSPNRQVLSVSTQKQFGATAGSWMVTLVGIQWRYYINPQDIAVIQMWYDGDPKRTTVMVGLVDTVNQKRSVGADGKVTVNTVITGRDFGKMFVKDQLKFYPEISGKKASDFFLTDTGWINLMKIFTSDNIMKGTPAVIIENIMKHIFPKVQNTSWAVWNPKSKTPSKRRLKATELIGYNLGKIDFFMPFIFTADQYEGALWNLLDRASPKPFCELFIDTRDADEAFDYTSSKTKNKLVPQTIEKSKKAGHAFGTDGVQVVIALRTTPYESVHRNRITRWKIDERDVLNEDIKKSDEQHYNLFWAGTTVNPLGLDLKRVSPPLLNEENAAKYGLAPLEVNIEGMEIKKKDILEGMSKSYTGVLKTWFQNNHKYYSGTFEIRGKAGIRIGHMVEIGDSNHIRLEYYVEGVQQTFTVYQGWTTTLSVTRGMKIGTKIDSSRYGFSLPEPKPKKKATTSKPKSTFYTVKKGDTLPSIAKAKYGDSTKWRKIWEANKTMLIKRDKRNAKDNGHWIYPGQKLEIPPK